MFAKGKFDPELERLRNEVDGPPNLDTVALNIQRATAQIHASYLFEFVGKATLHKLCLLLGATCTGKTYSGWQEFAAHMGLTIEQIRYIDYNFKGLQDPTYCVLLTYVQDAGATIDKILSALQKIQRFDIISQIKDNISDLINAVSEDARTNESSILRPKSIPKAPLVLSPLNIVKQAQENRADSKNDTQDSLKKHKKSYSCAVMLTFANDGLETAERIAKIFRSKEPRIGVLILQEQENYVYSRGEGFIDVVYHQMNFIIPILTQGYIERINNSGVYIEEQNKLDSKYLKYIYTLLRDEYVKNQCVNFRVRCIVPDKEVSTIVQANLHPTLQAWFTESNIDTFAENILLGKRSK